MKKLFALLSISLLTIVTLNQTVSAHVTVKPTEVTTASYQIFTVSVPNEKDIPTTSIKLLIPAGVESVTPTIKSGWNIQVESGSVTWSGGTINKGLRDEFTLSAKTPANQTDLQWKAYQTYNDGTTVSWDKAEEHGDQNNSGPFSVTKVQASVDDDHNDKSADTALPLYLAGFAVVVSLGSIYIATKKK